MVMGGRQGKGGAWLSRKHYIFQNNSCEMKSVCSIVVM